MIFVFLLAGDLSFTRSPQLEPELSFRHFPALVEDLRFRGCLPYSLTILKVQIFVKRIFCGSSFLVLRHAEDTAKKLLFLGKRLSLQVAGEQLAPHTAANPSPAFWRLYQVHLVHDVELMARGAAPGCLGKVLASKQGLVLDVLAVLVEAVEATVQIPLVVVIRSQRVFDDLLDRLHKFVGGQSVRPFLAVPREAYLPPHPKKGVLLGSCSGRKPICRFRRL